MEKILVEFINTLDLSLKKLQKKAGANASFSYLTISQLQYIDAINDIEKPTITQIADRLQITRASVTVGINKLVDLGYATKTRSEEDRRVCYVGLTEASAQLLGAKQQALREYGKFIASALTKEEAKQFETILTKLVNLFQQA